MNPNKHSIIKEIENQITVEKPLFAPRIFYNKKITGAREGDRRDLGLSTEAPIKIKFSELGWPACTERFAFHDLNALDDEYGEIKTVDLESGMSITVTDGEYEFGQTHQVCYFIFLRLDHEDLESSEAVYRGWIMFTDLKPHLKPSKDPGQKYCWLNKLLLKTANDIIKDNALTSNLLSFE